MTREHSPPPARAANPARAAAVCVIPAPVCVPRAHCNFAGRVRIEHVEGAAAGGVLDPHLTERVFRRPRPPDKLIGTRFRSQTCR